MRVARASRARRAFTLIEILVAVTILGIIGAGLVRLLLSQARFTEAQMASRNARSVSRNAMNIMLTDLRMVQDYDGLQSASSSRVTLRVPVAFGLYCGTISGISTLALFPVDSAMKALGQYGGWAIRDSTSEHYSYVDANPPIPFKSLPAGVALTCTAAGITTITYNGTPGDVVQVGSSAPGPAQPGWPAFIYHEVTYEFANSQAFPGRVGLFRRVKSGSTSFSSDEIVAPFDTSAKFRFYVLNADVAQSAVPSNLNTVRGLQLYLAGSSPRVPQGASSAAQTALVTGVFFKNRSDP